MTTPTRPLEISLLALRFSVAPVLLVWAVDKLVRPEHAAACSQGSTAWPVLARHRHRPRRRPAVAGAGVPGGRCPNLDLRCDPAAARGDHVRVMASVPGPIRGPQHPVLRRVADAGGLSGPVPAARPGPAVGARKPATPPASSPRPHPSSPRASYPLAPPKFRTLLSLESPNESSHRIANLHRLAALPWLSACSRASDTGAAAARPHRSAVEEKARQPGAARSARPRIASCSRTDRTPVQQPAGQGETRRHVRLRRVLSAAVRQRAQIRSGTGWPSFTQPIAGQSAPSGISSWSCRAPNIIARAAAGTRGMSSRTARRPRGERWCNNGLALCS